MTDSADRNQQRDVIVAVQAKLLLEGALAETFADKTMTVVISRKIQIGRGIPNMVIRAVKNAGEIAGPFPQRAVETAAEFRRQDFAGIARADGGQGSP